MPVKKKAPARRKAPVRKTMAQGKPFAIRKLPQGPAPLPNIPNYRMFEVRYLGPTYSSGSRVKITDLRFEESKTIPYDQFYNSSYEVAQAYLKRLGIKLSGKAEGPNGYFMWTNNFETSIKEKK
jgi:hypothetical protein